MYRDLRWARALTRQINEFFLLQLPGFVVEGPKLFVGDDDQMHEQILAIFTTKSGYQWRMKVETPAETATLNWGSNGRISLLEDGSPTFEGPIDVLTWKKVGEIIRAQGSAEA